jgi:hypothetical protein
MILAPVLSGAIWGRKAGESRTSVLANEVVPTVETTIAATIVDAASL